MLYSWAKPEGGAVGAQPPRALALPPLESPCWSVKFLPALPIVLKPWQCDLRIQKIKIGVTAQRTITCHNGSDCRILSSRHNSLKIHRSIYADRHLEEVTMYSTTIIQKNRDRDRGRIAEARPKQGRGRYLRGEAEATNSRQGSKITVNVFSVQCIMRTALSRNKICADRWEQS